MMPWFEQPGGVAAALNRYDRIYNGTDCDSCAEQDIVGQCPNSRRECGHHCNHSWSHDECCWCGKVFVGDKEEESDA